MQSDATSDSPDVAAEKRRQRDKARAERRELPLDHEGCCQVLARFLDEAVPQQQRVVIYQAMESEINLSALVLAHPDPGTRFAVTRTPDAGLALTVHPWGVEQERHRFGYSQPVAGSPMVADDDIGAVLVPALAFDERGARLGHGMGYYDRFLGRLAPSCLRVGITGDYLVDRVPVGPFDVVMTHLAYSDRVVVL